MAVAYDTQGRKSELTKITVEVYNPPVNAPPTIRVLSPANDTAFGRYSIRWEDDDPDDDAEVTLYYDTDSSGYDGVPILRYMHEDYATDFYTWNLASMPVGGSYWIYAKIDDHTNPPVYDYSPGRLTIVEPAVVDRFTVAGVEMVESSSHDNDGIPDAGEEIDLDVDIYNKTSQQQCTLKGYLSTTTPGVTITDRESGSYISPLPGDTRGVSFAFSTTQVFSGVINLGVQLIYHDCSSGAELQDREMVAVTVLQNDVTPPTITTLPTTSTISSDAAVIVWTTNDLSTSVVEYGTTLSYGQVVTSEGLVTDHRVNVRGLASNTTYFYRVNSTDASGNGPTQATGQFVTAISGSGGLHVEFAAESELYDDIFGLAWDGGYLWALTRETGYWLRKLDPATGDGLFSVYLSFAPTSTLPRPGMGWRVFLAGQSLV